MQEDHSSNNGFEPLALSTSFSRVLCEQVASQLRQAILNGRLKPGQRIVEHDIAAAMEMSRGPVRDALRILENERLVVRYPNRGTFVAWLTLRDAEEIYSLRAALETLAIEYATRHATGQQLSELDQVVDAMEARLPQNYDQFEATDLDLEFHHTLCRISGHSRVLAAWTALRAQVRLLILTYHILHPLDFREKSVEGHRRVVTALRQRDVVQAREVLHAHLAASFELAVEAIKTGATSLPDEATYPNR